MQDVKVIPAVNGAHNDTRIQETQLDELVTVTGGATEVDTQPHTKTHKRAGITKNHNRGQSKQRRKMAAASRRRNRE